jgi:CRP-like cAMP-binding protein
VEHGGRIRTISQLIAEHPVFTGLGPADLELVAGCGRNVAFGAGEYLFREGGPANAFFLVRHGIVALEVFVPDRGPLVLDTVGEGELAGVSWLFPPYRWQFDGRAAKDTRAVALDGACLRAKCDADPRLGYDLMKRFAAVAACRMHSARLRLVDLYGHAPAR